MRLYAENNSNYIRTLDTGSLIRLQVVDFDNSPVNLTEFEEVIVKIGTEKGGVLLPITITNKSNDGVIEFKIPNGTLPSGKYEIEVHMISSDNTVRVSPSNGKFQITVTKSMDELGQTVSVMSVQQLISDMNEVKKLSEITNTNSENAISHVEEAVTASQSAISKSDEALFKANQAIDKSNTALNTANNALEIANSTINKSDEALFKANIAESNSNDTKNMVNETMNTVNTTLNTANKALDDAESTITNVNESLRKANDLIAEVDNLTNDRIKSYNYKIQATSNGQTDFLIPLETFDVTSDIITVTQNRTTLEPGDFSIIKVDTSYYVRLAEGIEDYENTSISIYIIKGSIIVSKTIIEGTYLASDLTQDTNNRLVTDNQIAEWDEKETIYGSQSKANQALSTAKEYTDTHINDKNNPHQVTKEQIGLSNVDNTSDLDKPISRATQKALDEKFNITLATTTNDGLMSKEDKITINNIESNQQELNNHIENKLIHKQVSPDAIQEGAYSNVEGKANLSKGLSSHAEGIYTVAYRGDTYKIDDYDDTLKTITVTDNTGLTVGDKLTISMSAQKPLQNVLITAINDNTLTIDTSENITSKWRVAIKEATMNIEFPTHAEGVSTVATGLASHAEGFYSLALGSVSHAEGSSEATGEYSHSEGNGTKAKGKYSHAEGFLTNANSDASHAEGDRTIANASYSHAEGSQTKASDLYAHAEGNSTSAIALSSHAEGEHTTANVVASHASGRYNKIMNGSQYGYVNTDDAFVIGNGTTSDTLSNAFRVTFDGKVYGLSAFNSTGADYAEYFEWMDGNVNEDDRVGYFVTLEGDKIRIATNMDDYILGVVSVNPSIIGDSHQDDWANKYVTDEWGRIQYKTVNVPYTVPEYVNNELIEVPKVRQDYVPILNPDWDNSEPYVPREKRKEWSPIGIIGKLLVRDDGSCKVNGYCKPNEDGIATISENGYRVMERINENIIKVFIK